MKSVTLVPGLAALADTYDAVICDVWGVIHNGLAAYPAASDALERFRDGGRRPVVLLTNAPRPPETVATLLDGMGVPRSAYDRIVTSGAACQDMLAKKGVRAVHYVGPDRDLVLLDGSAIALVAPEAAELVVCTGLVDDDVEVPDDYRDRFRPLIARGLPFYCANPDIVVERGDRLLYCAGALAQLYEEMGGTVVMFGKPHKPVYDVALAAVDALAGRAVDPARVLAIGDALHTDIRGAWGQGLPVLMVTGGIHAAEFGAHDAPDLALVAKRLAIDGLTVTAAVPKLRW